MTFDVIPATDVSLREQARVFNAAFAGYLVGWTDLDPPGVARFVCAQGADFCYSRFIRAHGNLAGFAYINRTGRIARVAGMGVIPAARRIGAASYLLSYLIKDASELGDDTVILEVFEQNTPAVALYRRHHFRELMRLYGWRSRKLPGIQFPTIEEISILDAIQTAGPPEYPDIPWQVSRHAMVKVPGARAFYRNGAAVVIADLQAQGFRIYGIFFPPGQSEAARNVLGATMKRFADREFFAREIFPEQFGIEIFEPLGFAPEPLNQFLMRRDL